VTGTNRDTGYRSVTVPICPAPLHTYTERWLNPDLHGKKPTNNRLSYGTASIEVSFRCMPKGIWELWKAKVKRLRVTGVCAETWTRQLLNSNPSASAFGQKTIRVAGMKWRLKQIREEPLMLVSGWKHWGLVAKDDTYKQYTVHRVRMFTVWGL
jgi:hypothetical protein